MSSDGHDSAARTALGAAAELDLRAFCRFALDGAIALSGARAGAVYLAPVEAMVAGSRFERGEVLLTAPARESGLRRALSIHAIRLLQDRVTGAGEELLAEPSAAVPPVRVLVLPLLAGTRRAGLLLLTMLAGDEPLDEAGGAAVRELVPLLDPLLANVLRVEQLQELVVRDDLAGCFNRRHFDEFLPQEAARAARFRRPLSLIFMDVDDLKAINSAHGHTAGSLTLREVASRAAQSTRAVDKLFRFGGDEFCIILPETDLEGACRVAERVRRAIAAHPIQLEAAPPVALEMTASFGVATLPQHAADPPGLIAAADEAMRAIKDRGKNAIGVYGAPAGATPRARRSGAADHGPPA